MKKAELREIIREELKEILPPVLKQVVEQQVQKKITELYSGGFEIVLKERTAPQKQTQPIRESTPIKSKQGRPNHRPKEPTRDVKKYSKNALINDILKDTQPFSKTERVAESFDPLKFTSDMVPTNLSKNSGTKSQEPEIKTGVDYLDNALNRDYSDLMKLAKEKRGKV